MKRFFEILTENKLKYLLDRYDNENFETEWIEQIIKADPTSITKNGEIKKAGRYSEWIIRGFMSFLPQLDSGFSDNPEPERWFREDLPKITEDLKIFDRLKHKTDIKDINQIKGNDPFTRLYELVKPLKELQELEIGDDEYEKIYKGSDYQIIIPKTEKASCKYGAGTRWCTAAKENNYFDEYNKDGNLYILIMKDGRKFQYHPWTNQYMDEMDRDATFAPKGFFEKVFDHAINTFENPLDMIGNFSRHFWYSRRKPSEMLLQQIEEYKNLNINLDKYVTKPEHIMAILGYRMIDAKTKEKLTKKIMNWDIKIDESGSIHDLSELSDKDKEILHKYYDNYQSAGATLEEFYAMLYNGKKLTMVQSYIRNLVKTEVKFSKLYPELYESGNG